MEYPALEILKQTDALIWAREKDQLRALALLSMLSATEPRLAETPHMLVFERLEAAVQTGSYFLLYEKAGKDGMLAVPVGFVLYGRLSRYAAQVYANGLRPLRKDELSNGSRSWLLELVSHFGHKQDMLAYLKEMLPAPLHVLRADADQITVVEMP